MALATVRQMLSHPAPTELLAGGSVGHPVATKEPRFARRVWLLVEMGLFFLVVPLLMRAAIHDFNVPLIMVLQPLLLGFVVYLLWDDTFNLLREVSKGFAWRHLIWITTKFIFVGGAIVLATAWIFPELLFGFPIHRPYLWAMVMVLYPIFSVIPQELVFRTFFFHRYGPLFGDWRWLAVVTNGALFGFAHIIFNNWIAVIGTAVVGGIIAYRYWMTQSYWAVWLEHSLYGCLVFTVGLGGFFFTGVSNF